MSDQPIQFPDHPDRVLQEIGEEWMKREGVKGVGLAVRDQVLKFVVLADDPADVRDLPLRIGGYETSVELPAAAAANRGARPGPR